MSPFEIRLEILRVAKEILQARASKPEEMPTSAEVIADAVALNQFVSTKQD